MERSGFVFQRSYYDAVKMLDRGGQREEFLMALLRYAFEGTEPEHLTDKSALCFTLVKPTIDASTARYTTCVENGKKGGRPRKDAGKIQQADEIEEEQTRRSPVIEPLPDQDF